MRLAVLLYAAGVICAGLAGFLSPMPYLGFVPLAAGLIWGSYDLTEVTDGDASPTPQRRPVS